MVPRSFCRQATLWPAVIFSIALTCLLMIGPARGNDRILVVTTDWSSAGSLATLSSVQPFEVAVDLVPLSPDATVRGHGDRLYVVNRFGGDNIQVVDSESFSTIRQFSVGAGSNPQDIAVLAPDRAFVSRYETNDLLEVDPSTGALTDTISLASLADPDGLCEMHRMLAQGSYLYVQVQRLQRRDWPDPWVPVPPSYLAVIDLSTNELIDVDPDVPGIQGIALAGLNPSAPMQIDPFTGDLLVPEAGQFGVIDGGGIERIDLNTWRSLGMAINEAGLGGDVTDFSCFTQEKAFAIVSTPTFDTRLLSFDPRDGNEIATVYDPGGFVLTDLLATPEGTLFVCDQDYQNPGVRVYDASADTLIKGAIGTGLPPSELVRIAGSGQPGGLPVSGLGPVYPNPTRGTAQIAWVRDRFAPARVDVFDARGRRVRTLSLGLQAGEPILEWDGTDFSGRETPPGIYFLSVEGEDGRTSIRRVCRLR